MTTENKMGGSRMKVDGDTGLQAGQAAAQEAAAPGPAAAQQKAKPATAPRRPAAAKAPEIDYEKLSSMVASKMGGQTIITKEGGISNEGMAVGQMPDIILDDGTLAMGGIDIAAIDKPMNSDYFKELAFMEEEVRIMVHETEDQNAENPVIIGNNGIFKEFFRGRPTVAKRKFVDGLIVKSTRVTTPEILNPAGERTNIIKQHSAHKYSFSILQDRNPMGPAWLERRMAEIV